MSDTQEQYALAEDRYGLTLETLHSVWTGYPERFPNICFRVRYHDDLSVYRHYACLEVHEPPTRGGEVDVEEVIRQFVVYYTIEASLPGTIVDIEIHRDSVDGALRHKHILNPIPGLCLMGIKGHVVPACPLVQIRANTDERHPSAGDPPLHPIKTEQIAFEVKGYARGDGDLVSPWNGRIQDVTDDIEVSGKILHRICTAYAERHNELTRDRILPEDVHPTWEMGR